MVELPFEIITHILSFSSVESLLRFRSLCKNWCALIDSSYFVKTHFSRSNQNRTNNLTLIFEDLYAEPDNPTLYSLKIIPTSNPQNTITPINYLHRDFSILGSCYGLVLLKDLQRGVFVLFNPSTRQLRDVPPAPTCSRSPECIYGIGYDSFKDDYKVIKVVPDDKVNFDAKVYSLKFNLWQNIAYSDYFVDALLISNWSAQVNGAVHMIVGALYDYPLSFRIVAFDVASTNFYLVPTPDFVGKSLRMSVDVLGGCLCLIRTFWDCVNVWVMRVYGVKESWTKLFSISSLEVKHASVRLLVYSKSGDDVLLSLNGNKLIWYDLKRSEIKNSAVSYFRDMYLREVCMESLVSLDGYGEVVTQEAT